MERKYIQQASSKAPAPLRHSTHVGRVKQGHEPGTQLPKQERTELINALFGAAAKYHAMSVDRPTLPENIQLPLHRKIALLRGLRGWTQKELASHANVSQAEVSRAESGPAPENSNTIRLICQTLEMPL